MKPLIVTGMSGAGKHTAIQILEDFGYNCVDNLPVQLFQEYLGLTIGQEEYAKSAVCIDIRNGRNLSRLKEILDEDEAGPANYDILFLDADDSVLVKRYKETRHMHPISKDSRVAGGIAKERKEVSFLKERADFVIDTTRLLTKDLRTELSRIFVDRHHYKNLFVTVLSFGFKYGIPQDADLVFDVRFLPNPFYDPLLRPLTGNDEPIWNYVTSDGLADEFIGRLGEMMDFLIPNYIKEGKTQLVIGIGCTGGKHRSVAMANALYKRLDVLDAQYGIRIEHRDIDKDAKRGK